MPVCTDGAWNAKPRACDLGRPGHIPDWRPLTLAWSAMARKPIERQVIRLAMHRNHDYPKWKAGHIVPINPYIACKVTAFNARCLTGRRARPIANSSPTAKPLLASQLRVLTRTNWVSVFCNHSTAAANSSSMPQDIRPGGAPNQAIHCFACQAARRSG